MLKSLLIFSIGPVQSFIEQSRKTQDLYAGSFILSHLSRHVMVMAQNSYGAEIIYPSPDNSSLPNRFVALLEERNKEELQKIGNGLQGAVREEFMQMGQKIVEAFNLMLSSEAKRQLETFLEFHWVAGPCPDDGYAACYGELESTLAAVKNVRAFAPLDEQGRKCGLTGEHNALFYRTPGKAHLGRGATPMPSWLPPKYLQEGECLSSIGLLKRCADKFFHTPDYQADFPSTAKVALMETLERLPPEKLRKYQEIFQGAFDEKLYYEDNLTEKVFAREGIPPESLEPASQSLRELYKTAGDQGFRFTRYYAVLCLDGDDMGRWVGGAFLAEDKELLAFQRQLTEGVGRYSSFVRDYLQSPKARRVYCGGDDVLAFLNLNHLITVMQELRKKFPKFQDISGTDGRHHSSASCGVCIAHYKTPLPEVLKWARHMEEKAKQLDKKDAFGIAVLKHSGEIGETVAKWQYDNVHPLDLLLRLVEVMVKGEFSDTFIRSLAKELKGLIPSPQRRERPDCRPEAIIREGFHASEEAIVQAEIGRLLRRSCQLDKREGGPYIEQTVTELQKGLMQLYLQGLENFLFFLEMAAFLSREVNKI
jgi:CRISPR-associated protein Cmr2